MYGHTMTVLDHTMLKYIVFHILQVRFTGFSLTCSEWVEEEKELANSGADIERVEGLL